MTLRKTLLLISLAASTACLAVGYLMAGQWLGAGLVILPGLAVAFSPKLPFSWLPPAYLAGAVCCAAVGLFLGTPAVVMFCAAASALAAWELMNGPQGGSARAAMRFEMRRARSLALALGFGLVLAVGALLVSVRIPFVVLVLMLILCLFSVDRVSRYLGGQNQDR